MSGHEKPPPDIHRKHTEIDPLHERTTVKRDVIRHAIKVESMELQELEEKTTELVPYKRGISLSKVAKGTLARFLPGSVIGMGALSIIIPPGGVGGLRLLEFLLLHQVGPLAIGFGLGLVGLHRWLFPDSEVTGRRGVIAGLLSPVAMLGAGVLTQLLGIVPLPQPALVSFLVGIVMALVMFFPWLSPTPEERRADHYEPDQPDQLPNGSRHAT